jgi:hypothetical protein
MEGKLYCIPCQDAHKMTPSCLQDVQCKLCSRKGHLRIDCPENNPHLSDQKAKLVALAEYFKRQVAKRKASSVDTVDSPAKALKYNTSLFSSEDECQIDETVVIISDDKDGLHEKEFDQENNVRSEEIKLKTKEKKSPKLKEGDYPIVSIHIELFRSNKSTSTKLTQLSCFVYGSDSFFRGIKPRGLKKYLDNYKVGGDLLKALHMTREDDGTFLYRSQFEIVEDENKILCVDEGEALMEFLVFLEDFPRCVILGVDEESVSILVKKLKEVNKKKVKELVVGFTYWKRVLKYLNVSGYRDLDLEEYFTQTLQKDLSSLTIPEVLLTSVMDVATKIKKEEHCFYKLCKRIDCLEKAKNVKIDRKAKVEKVEVFSSFRPSVSATYSVEKLEQVTLSSESDSEPEETGRSISNKVETTARSILSTPEEASIFSIDKDTRTLPLVMIKASEQIQKCRKPRAELQKMPIGGKTWLEGTMSNTVNCPICPSKVRCCNIKNHLERVHHAKVTSLLCGNCKIPVSPGALATHMPGCDSLFNKPAQSNSSQSEPSNSSQSEPSNSSQSEPSNSSLSESSNSSQSKPISSPESCINKKMCDKCSLSFKTAGLLRRHTRTDHGGRSSVS